MTYLETILRQICSELNKDYTQVQKFQTILENEWIDNEEALRITKEDELIKLGIPRMLVKKLKLKVAKAPPTLPEENQLIEEKPPAKSIEIIDCDSIDEIKETKDELVEEIDDFLPSKSEIRREKENRELFYDLLKGFVLENKNNVDFALKCLGILQKLLMNIIKSPSESKFRLLKRGNKALESKIFVHGNLVQILLMLGFEDLSGEKLQQKCPALDLAPAARNYFLAEDIMNLDSIENVVNSVREVKSDLDDFIVRKPTTTQHNSVNHSINLHTSRHIGFFFIVDW